MRFYHLGTMRKPSSLFAFGALVMFVLATPIHADVSPQKRALISELIRVSGAADITVGYIADMFAEQYGRPKGVASALWMREQMGSSIQFRQLVENTRMEIYDRYFTEKQLTDLVNFYQSDTGKHLVEVQERIDDEARRKVAGALMEELQVAAERSRQKRTMADMMTLATALEARATDTNNYPVSGSIDEIAKLLEPTYVRQTPKKDAWSNEYRYVGSSDGLHYRFVSAGPDKAFDPSSGTIGKLPATSSDDLIYEDGAWVRPQSPKL